MPAVLSGRFLSICRNRFLHNGRRSLSNICYHSKVKEALKNGDPVVALESTIITHGMPRPVNVNTARSVERIIQEQGAVPATIALLDGKIHIGLSGEELELLSSSPNLVKISRRDLPYALGKGLSGGTTVSATMLIAKRVGIPIFVTGGIGGVHRGAETSFDISADLTELGRTPITVISSGVKSILDIGKTLEYLETQGVCVLTYGTSSSFPSFFTATSDFTVPASVTSPLEAANIISSRDQLGLENGILIANPIPEDFQADKKQIDEAIRRALEKAESQGIKGKAVTPFLLEEVNEITKGRSLESNIALIQNNALVGAKIAVELKKLERSQNASTGTQQTKTVPKQRVLWSVMDHMRFIGGGGGEVKEVKEDQEVVVIGGSIVDFVATVLEDDIKLNATTHRGNIRRSFGGVARNVTDCLTRLGHRPLFLSAVGSDNLGEELIQHNKGMVTKGFTRIPGKSTATYCVILDKKGNFAFGIGDMSVHQDLSIQYIKSHMDQISKAKLVVMDGNSPVPTIEYVLDACKVHGVPVWYETTDVQKAVRPFLRNNVPESLHYISPNIIELNAILNTYKLPPIDVRNSGIGLQEEVSAKCKTLIDLVPNIIVTMGQHGVAVISRPSSQNMEGPHCQFYPAPDVLEKDIVSVSGAGDCFAGGYISGLLRGYSMDQCSQLGTLAAKCSLIASPAVPETITPSLSSLL